MIYKKYKNNGKKSITDDFVMEDKSKHLKKIIKNMKN